MLHGDCPKQSYHYPIVASISWDRTISIACHSGIVVKSNDIWLSVICDLDMAVSDYNRMQTNLC